MGITIHYRGRLADVTRIEDFEDRLLDLALEVGGLAQIWRSQADDRPERLVRGIILDLAPGMESTSLLVSPEGWLIGLTDIEDAERGRLTEPPWCFTKTQFGPIEGHVALVETLAALKREFVPDLEVSDEGGYWETRDLVELLRRRSLLQEALDALAEGLQRHGLSREAAEDPTIVAQRIERIAAQVHRILQRPAEHPPVSFPDEYEPSGVPPDTETTEKLWDELYKHNRRQQERMERALEERRSRGEDDESAFENALSDLGLEAPGEETQSDEDSWDPGAEESFGSDASKDESGVAAEPEDPFKADEEDHPLLTRATDLYMQLHDRLRDLEPTLAAARRTLFQGAGDTVGGLAQALSKRGEGEDEDDEDEYGLRITQLKRALRGAAFARGALFPLRGALDAKDFTELQRSFGRLEKDIFQEIGRLRARHRGEQD